MTEKKIEIGKDDRYLSPVVIEKWLRSKPNIITKGGWTKKAISDGVIIDLTLIEWITIPSLVQLVLIIESMIKASIPVDIQMPLGEPTEYEKKWMSQKRPKTQEANLRNKIDARKQVRNYLSTLRLNQALDFTHLSAEIKRPCIFNPLVDKQVAYTNIFPLTWLNPDDTQAVSKIRKFTKSVISAKNRGLVEVDARALTNVILYELFDNVSKHAGKDTWGLVCIGAIRMSLDHKMPINKNILSQDEPFHTWIRDHAKYILEIGFGDSGLFSF